MARMFRMRQIFVLLAGSALLWQAAAVAPQESGSSSAVNVLTWVESGAGPQDSSPSAPGDLGLMDGSGTFTKQIDVPPQTSTVHACGEQATSPDGNVFAFYMGLDTGTLYMMKGAELDIAH